MGHWAATPDGQSEQGVMTLIRLKSRRGFASISTSLELQRHSVSVSPPVSSENEIVRKVLATSNEISAAQIIFPNARIDFPYDACTKLIRLIVESSTIGIQGGSL